MSYLLSRINIPATMPSTAKPVVTVEEGLILSKGKRPVRINHSPSKSIPRFLPAKPFVTAIFFSFKLKYDYASLISDPGIGPLVDNNQPKRPRET
jgi:hypothetical protein